MSAANDLASDEAVHVSLDEPTSDANRPSRLKMVEMLKTRDSKNPAACLLVRFLRDADWLVQQAAFEALRARPDMSKHLLADLITLLPQRENRVRWRACELLSELGSEASAALAALHELEPDYVVARAIWKIGGQKQVVIPTLVKLMDQPDEGSCDLIYEIGPDASPTVPSLIKALTIDDADLKWAAVDALGAIGPKAAEAVPALVELLGYASGLVAGRAATTLALIGPASVPALIAAMQSDNPRTREFAADALSQIGEAAKSAAPYLKQRLNDQNPDVAGWTAVALAKTTKEQSVVSILIQIINETSNNYLRQQATVALDEIVEAQKWKEKGAG